MDLYPGHYLNRITPADRPTHSTPPATARPAPADRHRIPSRLPLAGGRQSTPPTLPSPAWPPPLPRPARSGVESPTAELPQVTTPGISFGSFLRKMIHRPRAVPQPGVGTDGLLDEPLGALDRLTHRLAARQARGDGR